jgi:DNA-binding CsgD family transcriptional regulator
MDAYRTGLHRKALKRRDKLLALKASGLSMAEIGRRLGITRERVRQICSGKYK